MSKGSILKSSWVNVNSTKTRVIDSNALAELKIKEVTAKIAEQRGEDLGDSDGFVQGLNAVDVSELVYNNELYLADEFENSQFEEQVENQISPTEELIAEAQEQIEAMKQQAMQEIEQARAIAVEEGRKQGFDEGYSAGKIQGYDEGHQHGLDSAAEQSELLIREAEQKALEIEKEYQKKINELEPKFIETLTGIYEHIFRVSLKGSRELIVYLIQNTMKNIEGNSSYLIHVSRDDYPFASMQKKELLKGTNISIDSVEIIEDVTLNRNECMIETGNGVFDCSLGTQLELLREQLRLLSYEPE